MRRPQQLSSEQESRAHWRTVIALAAFAILGLVAALVGSSYVYQLSRIQIAVMD